MRKSTRLTLIVVSTLVGSPVSFGTTDGPKITVKISFVEALDPKDTTSSKRFADEYADVIKTATKLTFRKVATCGYRIETSTALYGASDPIQAKEHAEKAVKDSAWLIVGPRRSNHYLLLVKGAGETPTISLMASADEVASLPKHHMSMVPLNKQMAEVAAAEAMARLKNLKEKNYATVVNADCLSCKDFAKQFDSAALNIGLNKSAEFLVVGDQPDLKAVQASLSADRPRFILVPNFSIATSFIISKLSPALPDTFFVGGDGWGTKAAGFVQYGRDLGQATGFTVRGTPPTKIGLEKFALGREILKTEPIDKFSSATALSILKIFDGMQDLLCQEKPKDANAFRRIFPTYAKTKFFNPWGISIYTLEHNSIEYLKSVEAL